MKIITLKIILLVSLFLFGTNAIAQNSQKTQPENFTIKQKEIDKLFSYRPGTKLSGRGNKYLAKGTVVVNTKNGDTRFLRLQLAYFKTAFLHIQVNGSFSTQVFIVSDDKSAFYKGKLEKGNWLMKKCDEDEIVSE